jgi:hypothetical protein
MGMVLVCRAKSGGWASTTGLAVAACWPDPRWVPLVEADVSGGAVAARARVGFAPGLVELAADARPGAGVEVLARHTQRLACGVDVVVGPVRARQAGATVAALAACPGVLAGGDGTLVLVDVGHLAPGSAAWPLLAGAAGMVVCAAPTLEGLAAGIGLLEELRAARVAGRVWLVLCGPGEYGRPAEVEEAAGGVPVAGVLPWDARTAAALYRPGGAVTRTALGRAGRRLAVRLATDLSTPTPQASPLAVPRSPVAAGLLAPRAGTAAPAGDAVWSSPAATSAAAAPAAWTRPAAPLWPSSPRPGERP